MLQRDQDYYFPDVKQFKNRREQWPRHLRVIDAKDQGATHQEIYEYFSNEYTGGDDDALDEFSLRGTQTL